MSKIFAGIEISKKDQPVFIDTSIFIYLFEDHPKYAPYLTPLFDNESIIKTSSIITLAEILAKPFEQNNNAFVDKYKEVFTHLPNLKIVSPNYETAIWASRIKAKYQFSLIDSFQLALTSEHKCLSFLTNDKQLIKFKDIPIIYLDKHIK